MEKFKIYYLYFTVFTAGLAVLVIEILGTRILAPFFGSTIFVWSALISVTLAMLAVGYWLGGRLADRKPKFQLFYLIIFLSSLFVFLIPKLDQRILLLSERYGLRFGPLAASFLLFAAPLFLLGAVSPYAIRLRASLIEKMGRTAGNIFAVSTIGSLLGALLAGFYLIPLLTITNIFNMVGLILAVSSAAGWLIFSFGQKNKAPVLIIVALAIFFSPSLDLKTDGSRILFQKQSFYGDIKIVRVGPFKCLYVDGSGQSCIRDDKTTDSRYIEEVGQIIEQLKVGKMLVLGMGGGAVFSVIPAQTQIDAVELDPEAVAAAYRLDLVPERQVNLIYDDARGFVRKTEEKYDFILVDLARGNYLPSYMFTLEAFNELKEILAPAGLIFFHLSLTPQDKDDLFFASLIKTLDQAFGSHQQLSTSAENLYTINLLAPAKGALRFSQFYFTKDLKADKGKILRDDYNPLEVYYLPYALELRKSAGALGKEIFMVN